MTIEEALAVKLSAVLSSLVGDRIYADALPETEEDDLPASVVYQRAGEDDGTSLNGGRSATRIDTYTLELWSRKRSDGVAFRELMKAAFAGRNCFGRWAATGDPPTGGVWVDGAVARDAEADAREPVDGGSNPDRAERLTLRIVYDTSR